MKKSLRSLLPRQTLASRIAEPAAPTFLTRVKLIDYPDRKRVHLRFGNPISRISTDEFTGEAIFGPNLDFALVYWEANDYGTIRWQLKIIGTVEEGNSFVEIYGIDPGAQVLLRVSREVKVKRVLALIDAIEAQKIDPADVPPSYWNVVHNRLCANLEPPIYTRARHLAYLRLLAVQR